VGSELFIRESDHTVFGPGGLIPIRIYTPDSAAPLPLCVFAHGGGWVAGSLESHDKLCRLLANRLRMILVAVDYRLAPEHDFPDALDDVEAIWHWCRERSNVAGADRTRYVVAGDSSGGNLAAALSVRLKRLGQPLPSTQVLLYPALDARCSSPSYTEFSKGYNLSAGDMQWYWQRYAAGAALDNPELSPLAAPDVNGLPPTVVAVAECDVLRDDGVEYAARLAASGVPTELVRCDGMVHGFLRWTGSVPAATGWIDRIAASARRLLPAAETAPVAARQGHR
jgi:acetyl esterase